VNEYKDSYFNDSYGMCSMKIDSQE